LLVGFAPGTGSVLALYRNDQGRFLDVTIPAGLALESGAVRQPSWVDVDADGDLDLYVAFRDRADALFRNDKGRFTDIAPASGLADTRKTVGAVWFDYDEDGDLDMYAAHMDGDANGLYRNDNGKFTDVAEAAGVAWGGRGPRQATSGTVRPCVADVDGDGRFDLFMANYGPNGLFLNRGNGKFEDVSAAWGIAVDGRHDTCAFADVDHDGRVDLYVNGTVTGGVSYRDYLFRNTGATFEDVTPASVQALAADHGALWADFDRDGDEDLALTGAGPTQLPLVLRNMMAPAEARRSLRIRVVDAKGRATRPGAEVRVYEAGTRRLLSARLVDSGSSYDGQSDLAVHVGIASAPRVDVEAVWPAAGTRAVTSATNVALSKSRMIVIRTK
nr:CRTAC1 family protein [Acidobacteriota bacterium]